MGCKFPENWLADKTTFTDLSTECQLLVLEKLDFPSLLRAVEINEHFSTLALDVFRRKHSKSDIILQNFSLEESLPKFNADADIISTMLTSIGKNPNNLDHLNSSTNGRIEIQNMDETLATLTYFGHVISHLKFQYLYMNDNEAKTIAQYIGTYCAKSLIDIEFDSHYQPILRYLQVPFKMAKNITFKSSVSNLIDTALPMNQLFPALKHLKLNGFEEIDNNYIVTHLPQLMHLTFNAEFSYGNFKNVVQMIEMNPQIESIDLINITPKFLGRIVGVLPNLKTLTLWTRFDNIDETHFDSVTKFDAKKTLKIPQNFTFSHLEELSMKCDDEQCDDWVIFSEKHRNLRRLHVKSATITDEQFENLTDLPDLEEVSVFLLDGHFIAIESLEKFMNGHSKLNSFHLNSCKKIDKENLYVKFERKWTIMDYQQCLTFERI